MMQVLLVTGLLQAASPVTIVDSAADAERDRSLKVSLTAVAHGLGAGISVPVLYRNWYQEYSIGKFHFVNDMNHWNGMDKAGHLWSAYTLARLSACSWQWAGVKKSQAIYTGASVAVIYQTAIEVADGLSSGWGFSWGDFGANLLGAGMFLTQEKWCGAQYLRVKVMTWKPYHYLPEMSAVATELFGSNPWQRLLSDYNQQTYWLSFPVPPLSAAFRDFAWLNLTVGYGSRLMLGETSNRQLTAAGQVVDRMDILRRSRWLLAPDVNFTRIKTKSRALRALFTIADIVKFPGPALEYTQGRVRFHWLLLN